MTLTSILAQNMTEATMMSTYHQTKDIEVPYFKKITSRAPAPSRVSVGKWQVRTCAPALETKTDGILGVRRIKSACVEWKEVTYQPLPPAEPPPFSMCKYLDDSTDAVFTDFAQSPHEQPPFHLSYV
jgi:hypothetical protein